MSTDLRACWCSFLIIFGFFSNQNQKEYRILNSEKMNGTRGRYVAASEASSCGQNTQIQTRVNWSKAYQRESKDCHANLNIPLRRHLPKILNSEGVCGSGSSRPRSALRSSITAWSQLPSQRVRTGLPYTKLHQILISNPNPLHSFLKFNSTWIFDLPKSKIDRHSSKFRE